MGIMEALERAKQMGKLRQKELAEQSERAHASHVDSGAVSGARDAAPFERRPVEHFAALERVEFDLAACAQYNILLTDEQATGAGHAAAAYRLMRGRVLHRIKDSNWSCIGITSAGPGEGKTVTTLNLAISIARDKQRVVYLLDLDMRKPGVWDRCGCRPTGQLSQYFAGDLTSEKVLYETSVENLVVAGACDPVQGASELLASTRLDELLKYIRRRSPGALVLIDLPPVLSTDEALVVAPRIDALFLVVCEGVTRRDRLARAIDMLGDFTVAGVILNRSTEGLGTDYYGY